MFKLYGGNYKEGISLGIVKTTGPDQIDQVQCQKSCSIKSNRMVFYVWEDSAGQIHTLPLLKCPKNDQKPPFFCW